MKIKDTIVIIMKITGFVASLFGAAAVLFNLFDINRSSRSVILVITIAVLVFVSLIVLLIQELRFNKLKNYTIAHDFVNNGIALLADVYFVLVHKTSADNFRNKIKLSLIEIENAFHVATGKECNVAIYIVLYDYDNNTMTMSVNNLFEYESDIKKISDNTEFSSLFEDFSKKVYFKNKLPYPGYVNSSYTAHQLLHGQIDYKSVIVWPIRKIFDNEDDAKLVSPVTTKQDLVGYLHVTSKDANVFNKKYDIRLGTSYSNALYTVVSFYLDILH